MTKLRQMKQIVKNWKSAGLLDGLDEKYYYDMSLLLNNVAQLLINMNPQEGVENYDKLKMDIEILAGQILPIARRVFEDVLPNKIPSAEWLIEDYKKFTSENREEYNLVEYGLKEFPSSSISLSDEQDFINKYCKDVSERLKNESNK